MKLRKDKILLKLSEKGLTQTDIALNLGVSRQLIGAWINGDRNPKICNVMKIADCLDCKVDEIAEIEREQKQQTINADIGCTAINYEITKTVCWTKDCPYNPRGVNGQHYCNAKSILIMDEQCMTRNGEFIVEDKDK